MTTGHRRATEYLTQLLAHAEKEELLRRLAPDSSPALPEIPRGTVVTEKVLESRWDLLPAGAETREVLLDPVARAQPHLCKRNVENFIGTASGRFRDVVNLATTSACQTGHSRSCAVLSR